MTFFKMLYSVLCCNVTPLGPVSSISTPEIRVCSLNTFHVWLEINVSEEIKSNPKLLKPTEQNEGVKFQVVSREEMVTFVTRPAEMLACVFIMPSLLL